MKSGTIFKRRKKTISLAMALIWCFGLFMTSPALAAPQGGVVASGAATINQAANVTNINQSTQRAAINWQSFSVKPMETVNFKQPNASSLTLNRVIGNERSVIEGTINATGRVFLVNSNGILMTGNSSVNTAGFIASTLNITDQDFNAGNYVFKANGSTGSVINMGTITAKDEGYAALLGNSVSNEGVITATKGAVALASGGKITLNFNGDSLLNVTVNEGALNALVENKEAVYADGGRVIMTAKAADDLLSAQVNNTGIIEARTIDDLKGDIRLLADGGAAIVDGAVDASAPTSGDGGTIETSGTKVKVNDTAVITTKSATGKNGVWLIDPDGYTIGVGGDMTGAALTNALTNGNVTIASTSGKNPAVTDGNIDVNDPVSWSANTLTLNATKNIFVNNVMTATGAASFAANYGTGTNADMTPIGLYTYQGTAGSSIPFFTGKIDFSGSGKVFLNNAEYTVINDITGLNAARNNPAGNYALGSNWGISAWSAPLDNGTAFTGNFNGLGHSFTNFFPSAATSLFGTIGEGATVSNLSIGQAGIGASKTSAKTSAGILADVNQGKIVNSMVAGYLTITDNSNQTTNIVNAGGMVGINSGLIAQSFSYLTGGQYGLSGVTNIAGGLVGTNTSTGLIVDSSLRMGSISSGNYTGAQIAYVGGLAGVNEGKIYRSYVRDMPIKLNYANDTTSIAGAFVGKNAGTIEESYSTLSTGGSHFQAPRLGGFVGENTGTITNAYTTSLYMNDLPNASTQALADWTAGFAYKNSGTIKNAYATSYSTNSKQTRYGFVYDNTGGTIENAYWYAKTKTDDTTNESLGSEPVDSAQGVTKLTADQAAVFSNYTGLTGAANIWEKSASGYPILRNIPVYVITNTYPVPTYGLATSDVSTLNLTAMGLQGGGGMASLADSMSSTTDNPFTASTENGYVNAGIQNAADVLSSPVYSNIKGTVTVDPKELVIVGVVADKTYDATTDATLKTGVTKGGLVGLVENQTLNITYTSAQFNDKNAGISKGATVTYTGLTDGANGGKLSNYTIISDQTIANIRPKQISAGAATVENKVYDGTTDTAMSSYQLTGAIGDDDLALTGNAAFADKNAGQNKAVTISGLGLTGADAGNYTLQNTSLQATANIEKRPLVLAGAKLADGNASIAASDLTVMNAVGGDAVTIQGTATLASANTGVQPITNLNALTVNNPNYTLVGSAVIGSVAVGRGNRVWSGTPVGTADITTSGNTTNITTSDKAAIDWLRFNIASNETVNFIQPASTSIVLNRITGNEISVIAGVLTANGRVFIVNSNGALFTANSTVNTAGLVASALAITNDNFNNNNYVFTASNSGSAVNKGDMFIVDGGFVALASNNAVTHTGGVKPANEATPGPKSALFVAADNLTLDLNPTDVTLTGYTVGNPTGSAMVGGTVNVGSATGGGGLIETAGKTVTTENGFDLNTGVNGTWSLSLPSITIGAAEGITNAFVNTNLGLRSLSLNALTGSLTLNAPVAWATDSTLTLFAKNDVNINKSITATGENAGLVMNYGGDYHILTPATYSGAVLDANGEPTAKQAPEGTEYAGITLSGAYARLRINGNSYKLIHNMSELDAADYADGVTRMYFNPKTGRFDTSIDSTKPGAKSYYVDIYGESDEGGFCVYNPATQKYDIPVSKEIGGVEHYYNPESKAYDLTEDMYWGNISMYYYNPASQKYDIESYNTASAKYYDLITGTYSLSNYYIGKIRNYFYDFAAAKYDIADYNAANGKYYDTATGDYTSTRRVAAASLYFNPVTGDHDRFSPYAMDGYYALAGNINASGTTYVTSPLLSLSGIFTGLGHTVSNLTIAAAPSETNIGLIGQAAPGSVIRDIGVVDAGIKAESNPDKTDIGALVGMVTSGTVSHAYSTGAIEWMSPGKSSWGTGGLIGYTTQATGGPLSVVSNSFSGAQITDAQPGGTLYPGSYSGGGLIGRAEKTTVLSSHATGQIHNTRGSSSIGGLIGRTQGTSVTDSYATGVVGDYNSSYNAGGLIGAVAAVTGYNSNVINSFATGNVYGLTDLGGLIGGVGGTKNSIVTIDSCYAKGDVRAEATHSGSYNGSVGGLIATASYANISNCHADGNVFVDGVMMDFAGGLVGDISNSTIMNSYALGEVIGVAQLYGRNLGAHPTMTGGLLGHGADTVIIGSHAKGDVSGGGFVGALAGGLDGGSVIDSYSSGTVTGIGNQYYLGAVAGYIIIPEDYGPRTTFDNVYWNAANGNAFNNRQDPGNFSRALGGNEMSDVIYHVNHTIEMVNADRQAAAQATADAAAYSAAQQTAFEASANRQSGQTAGQVIQGSGSQSQTAQTGTNPSGRQQHTSVGSNIVFADSDSYGAHIKTITTEGTTYELGDSSKDEKK